ncbi:MAG: glycosyltransferase, partial [Sphingomonas sp.]
MRILHILDHGLPLHSGYTFRTRAILKAQQALGWTVAAVTGPRHGEAPAATETVDGLTFHRTTPPRALPAPLGEAREIAAFVRRIGAVVETFRPDILHAHSPVLDALAGLRVARRRGLPLVYEIRAFWEDAAVGNGTGREGSWRYRVTKRIETWAVQRADAVAVICEGLRDDLIGRGVDAGKIMVSPNGVDLTLFGEPLPRDAGLAAELGLAPDDDVLGFIGSFYDYEGLDDLIAAMP